jgi:hypothetical protein
MNPNRWIFQSPRAILLIYIIIIIIIIIICGLFNVDASSSHYIASNNRTINE